MQTHLTTACILSLGFALSFSKGVCLRFMERSKSEQGLKAFVLLKRLKNIKVQSSVNYIFKKINKTKWLCTFFKSIPNERKEDPMEPSKSVGPWRRPALNSRRTQWSSCSGKEPSPSFPAPATAHSQGSKTCFEYKSHHSRLIKIKERYF